MIKTKNRRAVTSISVVAIAALMIASVAAYDFADAAKGGPANKTSVGDNPGIGSNLMVAVSPTDGEYWYTIVYGTIKTSSTSDLVVSHNQECAIHTGLNLDQNIGAAASAIREDVRLRIDATSIHPVTGIASGGYIVPATFGDPITGDGLVDEGAVTFCGRAYQIDTNVLSTVYALCNIANTTLANCSGQEIYFDSYIRTKQTHSWDWIALNVGSGDHTVSVEVRVINELEGIPTSVESDDDDVEDSVASGACTTCVDTVLEIGKRNLIVIEDKLATFQKTLLRPIDYKNNKPLFFFFIFILSQKIISNHSFESKRKMSYLFSFIKSTIDIISPIPTN